MPRVSEVSPDYLLSKLKEWPLFNQNSLKGEKDSVWEEIKKSLNLKMTAKSLFLYVYKNKHNCKSELEKLYRIPIKNKLEVPEKDEDYLPGKKLTNPHNCEIIHFDITIPTDKIIDIQTKTKKKEWTDEVVKEIWNKRSLTCVYNFRNSYFTKNKFKFNGCCSDCGSGINGECILDEKSLNFNIKALATYGISHTKKRKLAGERRDAVSEILSGKTAMEYRDEKLEVMENKVEPPDLNTTQTLAKAREEILNKKLGFSEFKGMSISNKKFLSFCNVRTMSLDPFYIMYWSQEQVELWNMLRNSSLPLSFDSTGSVIKKYSFDSDYKSKSLFYYVVVVGFKKKNNTVGTSNFIYT